MENLDNDYDYYEYGAVERPPEWDNYKQEIKKESKENKKAKSDKEGNKDKEVA